MVIWSWSCVNRPFIRAGRLSIGDYKCLLGASAYNLKSISVLWLYKVWPLEIIAITFTRDFIPYFKIFDTSSREHRVACVQGTCSEDIRVNTFDMQLFTRFYGKFAYYDWFLISAQARDFSLWSWFRDFKFDFSDFGQGTRDFTECRTPRY